LDDVTHKQVDGASIT